MKTTSARKKCWCERRTHTELFKWHTTTYYQWLKCPQHKKRYSIRKFYAFALKFQLSIHWCKKGTGDQLKINKNNSFKHRTQSCSVMFRAKSCHHECTSAFSAPSLWSANISKFINFVFCSIIELFTYRNWTPKNSEASYWNRMG